MPKLWKDTIDAHRKQVRDAIIDSTGELVVEHGLRGVTMSGVAEETGIGRPTLYRYFSSVEDILHAWHERQILGHLAQLEKVAEAEGSPLQRLASVLEAYALIQRDRSDHGDHPYGNELTGLLHQSTRLAPAERHLHDLIERLVTEAAAAGDIRSDISPAELASYCLHALSAAGTARSMAAAKRLVMLTLGGLRTRD